MSRNHMFFNRMQENAEQRDSGIACLRYLVICFNTIFMMSGVFMISVGTNIFGIYYVLNEFLETKFFSPVSLIIVTGGFIFLVAIVGYISVAKESTLMINTYCVLLGFISIIQLSAGISAIVLKGNIGDSVRAKMDTLVHEYPFSHEAQKSLDFIQSKLECCGTYGPMDWRGILSEKKYTYKDIILPGSCCGDYSQKDDELVCFRTNLSGCFPNVATIIYKTIKVLFGSSLSLALMQLVGISFSHKLAKELIRLKSERLAQQILFRNAMQNAYETYVISDREKMAIYDDKPPSYDEIVRNNI